MTSKTLIQAIDLNGGYGDEMIVRDVSFQIHKGDFLGIIGPNGSGKSTLLKLISRALPVKGGRVLFEEEDIQHMSLKKLSQKIAFVPQDTMINFPFTVEEIVLMGRIPHLKRLQHESKIDRDIALRSLELTDVLSLRNKNINELSAGERQRVIIARALAQEPSLMFLDEPTSHLDIGHEIRLLDLLKKLNKDNSLTVVIVMHDLNLASEYCDRLMLLENGRIYKEGSAKDVLTYQTIEAVYNTIVVVKENPISFKPYCIPISESIRKQ